MFENVLSQNIQAMSKNHVTNRNFGIKYYHTVNCHRNSNAHKIVYSHFSSYKKSLRVFANDNIYKKQTSTKIFDLNEMSLFFFSHGRRIL